MQAARGGGAPNEAAAASVVRLLDRLEPSAVVAGDLIEAAVEQKVLQDAGEAASPLPATACVRVRARVRTLDAAPAVLRLQALRRLPAGGAADPAPADRIEPMPASPQLPATTVASPAEGARS